jgi:nucleoid-associated protein YgaU
MAIMASKTSVMSLIMSMERAFLQEKANPMSRVKFHFNPTTISFSKSAKYDRTSNQDGSADPNAQYLGPDSTELKLQILLDAVEELPGSRTVLPEVEKLLGWLGPNGSGAGAAGLAGMAAAALGGGSGGGGSSGGNAASPPELKFVWGKLKINGQQAFVGHLDHVDVKYELFHRDGTPLRAMVDLTLKSTSERPKGTNPTSGVERSSRRHVLRRGESIQSVAYAVYGDAAAWRSIAAANDIDDPLRVQPGRELLLPDGAERAGAAP